MANRNPGKPQRFSEANERKTLERIGQYEGTVDLLRTWELQPDEVQIANHRYILDLKAKVRNIRNYLAHRSDAKIQL